MGDELKDKGENTVGVIAGSVGEKASIVAVCANGAVAKGVKAGDLVREVAKLPAAAAADRILLWQVRKIFPNWMKRFPKWLTSFPA